MGHEVFISYAHEDKVIADAICAKLEENKIRCWIAPRDVQPGENFPSAIIYAIETSRIMVLVFSSNSNNSPHVVRELTKAVSKGVIIIPFRIEDISPTKDMEYLISVPHWLDALTPPLDGHITELIVVINKILDKKSVERPPPPQPPQKTNILILIAIIAILVAAISFTSPLFQGLDQTTGRQQSNSNPPPTTFSGTTTSPKVVNVSGIWTATVDSGGADFDATLDIIQTGNEVQGRFKLTRVDLPQFYVDWIVAGNIDGDELSLKYIQPIYQKPVGGFTIQNYGELQFWFDLKNSPPNMLAGRWADGLYLSAHGTITLTKKF